MTRHDGSTPSLLIALGGNALLPRSSPPDASTQVARIARAAPALASAARTHRLVITHGNGPQVGLLASESADDRALAAPYPFDALVAETQGLIGYWIQQALHEHLVGARHAGIATVITQTVVDPDDPSFGRPTKFVGGVMDEGTARAAAASHGWAIAPDGPDWRRVVASPAPVRVVEAPIIAALVEQAVTVVCAGGGGCPVVEHDERLVGVDAVVDKDAVAAWLAIRLGVERLVLLTDVDAVHDDFGTPSARPIRYVAASALQRRDFAEGSMAPKVAAACAFVEATGRGAAIGALDSLDDVLAGRSGTHVLAG